eukprot:NODE_63_length_26141_cov_1.022656.p8 type:complete len:389 gc:universal NODE_63_length_26141_cov_1.022656:5117-6283(+)
MFKKRQRKAANTKRVLEDNNKQIILTSSKKKKIEEEDDENIHDILEIDFTDKSETEELKDLYFEDKTSQIETPITYRPVVNNSSNEYQDSIEVDDSDLHILKRQGIAVIAEETEEINLKSIFNEVNELEAKLHTQVQSFTQDYEIIENRLKNFPSATLTKNFSEEEFLGLQKMSHLLNSLSSIVLDTGELISVANAHSRNVFKRKLNANMMLLNSILKPIETVDLEFMMDNTSNLDANKYFPHYAYLKKLFTDAPLIETPPYIEVWQYWFTIDYCYNVIFNDLSDIQKLSSIIAKKNFLVPKNLQLSSCLLFQTDCKKCDFFEDYLIAILNCATYSTTACNIDKILDLIFVFPMEWYKEEYTFILEELIQKLPSGFDTSYKLEILKSK